MIFAEGLQTGGAAGKSFAKKMGAAVHGQGKFSANLLDEVALIFLC
jgi:hypothetical protein